MPGDGTEARQVVGRLIVSGGRRKVLRKPEVQELHESASGEEDIARRDVAMNDAVVVRRAQRVGDLARDIDDLAEPQGPGQEPGLQACPFEELHRNEGLRFVLADLQDRADVGVVQRGGEPALRA